MSSPRVLVEMQNVIALYEMEKNTCDHIVVVLNFPRCRCKDLSWYVSMPITTLRGLSNILREVGFPIILLKQLALPNEMSRFATTKSCSHFPSALLDMSVITNLIEITWLTTQWLPLSWATLLIFFLPWSLVHAWARNLWTVKEKKWGEWLKVEAIIG